jgi:predicted nucleotidyltransferase component of viral defense system
MPDATLVYHEDVDLFRAALGFTAAETEFSERLIEKDYFCTVALADLARTDVGLTFKGGTCLSKIHADFFRLSEDLDFALSTPVDASRSQRRTRVEPLKSHLAEIEQRVGALRLVEPLSGFNNSMQYGGRLAYRSVVTGQDDFIKIEVSVREPIEEPPTALPARTLLLDPFRRAPAIPAVDVAVLTRREAYAEKIRAALSRREPAIRDFFDLDHAFSVGNVELTDAGLLELLRRKLSIPSNEPVDASATKLDALRAQLETQLQPVLRRRDYSAFDLDVAFRRIANLAARL